jgi:tetratricopeptide (TPR) repeat protein
VFTGRKALSLRREQSRELFREAQERHAAHDVASSARLAAQALELDPEFAEALEHLGMIYVTRRGRFADGLDLLRRAVDVRPADAGLWYSLGWCCEFAAQAARAAGRDETAAAALYQRAAEAFRRCLALRPAGKLADDAADLLELVEDRLRGS